MKRRKAKKRFGFLLFVVPAILIGLVVVYQIIEATYFQTGTLMVQAQSSDRYYPTVNLVVPANVGSKSGVTPFKLELAQGAYRVTFSEQQWYHTPSERFVNVVAGKTSYVVGVYDPIVKTVSISQGRFNSTQLAVMHGVTPVVWVNQMNDYVVMQSDLTGRVIIAPSQNFTYVFRNSGTFTFLLPLTISPLLELDVS